MKSILIHLEDSDLELLEEVKGDRTWKDLLLAHIRPKNDYWYIRWRMSGWVSSWIILFNTPLFPTRHPELIKMASYHDKVKMCTKHIKKYLMSNEYKIGNSERQDLIIHCKIQWGLGSCFVNKTLKEFHAKFI